MFVEQPLEKSVVLVNTNDPVVGSLGLLNTGENISHNVNKQLKVSAIRMFQTRTQHTQIHTKKGHSRGFILRTFRVPCPHHKLNVTRQTVQVNSKDLVKQIQFQASLKYAFIFLKLNFKIKLIYKLLSFIEGYCHVHNQYP